MKHCCSPPGGRLRLGRLMAYSWVILCITLLHHDARTTAAPAPGTTAAPAPADEEATPPVDPIEDPWLSSGKCGPKHLLTNGQAAECNPEGKDYCCNTNSGWCGNEPGHCTCREDCIDYKNKEKPKQNLPVANDSNSSNRGRALDDVALAVSTTLSPLIINDSTNTNHSLALGDAAPTVKSTQSLPVASDSDHSIHGRALDDVALAVSSTKSPLDTNDSTNNNHPLAIGDAGPTMKSTQSPSVASDSDSTVPGLNLVGEALSAKSTQSPLVARNSINTDSFRVNEDLIPTVTSNPLIRNAVSSGSNPGNHTTTLSSSDIEKTTITTLKRIVSESTEHSNAVQTTPSSMSKTTSIGIEETNAAGSKNSPLREATTDIGEPTALNSSKAAPTEALFPEDTDMDCGPPHNVTNSVEQMSNDRAYGTIVEYQCMENYTLVGLNTSTCGDDGWSDHGECLNVSCGASPSVSNSSVNLVKDNNTYHVKAVYKCNENYTIDGKDTSTCRDDTWSQPGKCLFTWCPELLAPVNGSSPPNERRTDNIASFNCDPGSKLDGQETITCQLGGNWSDVAPQCRYIDCGSPENVTDGTMTLLDGTTHLDSIVRYECEVDYGMKGSEERKCTDNWNWDGEPPICKNVTCGSPTLVYNSTHVPQDHRETYGAEVVYKCEANFKLVGQDTSICEADGTWSKPGKCLYEICLELEAPINGNVTPMQNQRYTDSGASFTCNDGYKRVGSQHITCNLGGNWSDDAPKCHIDCGRPNDPNDGKILLVNESTYLGSKVKFECNEGLYRDGTEEMTCMKSGKWSETTPTCKSSPLPLIIGILVCCILVLVGAVLAYNKYFKPIKRCISEEKLMDVRITEGKSVERPVDKTDLQDTLRRLMMQGGQVLSEEYRELRVASPIRYTEHASLETNRHKNRYINILPFDDSRVELQEVQGIICSDYINASYVHEYHQSKLFIACQGPMEATVGAFWRMVWEKNVNIIVMVTQCVEKKKEKCKKYWPEAYDSDGLVNRGDSIKVITKHEENHGAYTTRRFKVSQNYRHREVLHFHYTAWPDMGCPDTPDQLINFVTSVREAHRTLATPGDSHHHLVVHCSAGVGRTGTFIGLWNLMEEIQEPKPTVDVFNTVFNMRFMRCNMVQTQVQYSFLYKCILRHYMQLNGLGDATFPDEETENRPTTPDIVSSVRTPSMKTFGSRKIKPDDSNSNGQDEGDTDESEISNNESNNNKEEDKCDGKEQSLTNEQEKASDEVKGSISSIEDKISTAVCSKEDIPAEYTTTFNPNSNTDFVDEQA